jgi:hypothetical protein
MKYGLCNIGNSWVIIQKINVTDTLFIRKLNIFSTNVGHVILSKVMRFEIKVFEKTEVYDEFIIVYYV